MATQVLLLPLEQHPALSWDQAPIVKDVLEGDVKRTDDGLSIVGGTQLGNVKRSDDGPSVVGSTHRDMSYTEVVSTR